MGQFAVGQFAVEQIAVGQIAVGQFAVGQIAVGHFSVGQITVGTPKTIQGLDIIFLGLMDPCQNSLASTTYFAIVFSVFCMQGSLQ